MYNNIAMNSFFDFSSITANIIGGITVFLITVTIPAILIWLWRRFVVIKKLHEQELINVLSSIGANRLSIIKSKFFIKTMGQFNVPIEGCVENSNRFPLVNYFINQIFVKNDLSKKRFVVLGGSGMGKSTFITSLIFSYFQKYRYKKIPYNIYLVNLGNEDATLRIKELSKNIDANKSILILEAMDESTEAQNNNQEYLNFINKTSISFKYVIITCRTNLFIDEQSFPKYTGFYDGTNLLKFNIIHISQFSEQEIQLYLDNKYGIGTKKYQKSMTIKNNCNGLLSRAMILNFIDDLLDIASEKKITSFKIYYTIIEKWLCRELRIDNIGDCFDKVKKLYNFSNDIALYMYRTGKQYIPKEEYKSFYEKNGYVSDPYSYNIRSLITRRNDGAIKFAHKSFFDFFIAIIAFERPEIQFDANMVDSKEFAKEIYNFYLNEEQFRLINYYHLPSEGEDFTSSKLDIILDKIAILLNRNNDNEEEMKEKALRLFGLFWIELAKKLKNQYGNICIINNSDCLESLRSWMLTMDVICRVQRIFVSTENIEQIKKDFKEIQVSILSLRKQNVSSQDTISNNFVKKITHNELIIYPWIINSTTLEKTKNGNCIILGSSFSKIEDILSTIKQIIEFNQNTYKHICILLENNEKTYILNSIRIILTLLKDMDKEYTVRTIIQLLSDKFCYVINSDTIKKTESEICICVNNMLKS